MELSLPPWHHEYTSHTLRLVPLAEMRLIEQGSMGIVGDGDQNVRSLPLQRIPTKGDEDLEEMEVLDHVWPRSSYQTRDIGTAISPHQTRDNCAGAWQDTGNPLATRSTPRADQQIDCADTNPELGVGFTSWAGRFPWKRDDKL